MRLIGSKKFTYGVDNIHTLEYLAKHNLENILKHKFRAALEIAYVTTIEPARFNGTNEL